MNVLKKIIFFILFLAGGYICSAQEISIRGGFNLSQMPTKWEGKVTNKNSELKLGYHFGPVFDLKMNKLFSLETGLLYSTKGLRETNKETNGTKSLSKINIAYIDLPITLKTSFTFHNITISGDVGGYIAHGLFARYFSSENTDGTNNSWQKIAWGNTGEAIKRLDYGIILGIGVKIKALQLGLCLENGVADLVTGDPSSNRTFNKTYDIYIAYDIWSRIKKNHH